jgi:hypothetical protein
MAIESTPCLQVISAEIQAKWALSWVRCLPKIFILISSTRNSIDSKTVRFLPFKHILTLYRKMSSEGKTITCKAAVAWEVGKLSKFEFLTKDKQDPS